MAKTDRMLLPPLLGAGLVLGMLADVLLRTSPWGANVPIWAAGFMAVTALLSRRCGQPISSRVALLALPAFFFAACFAWRDSDTLRVVNGIALCSLLSLAALRREGGSLALGRVNEYSLGLLREWLAAPIAYLRSTWIACSLLSLSGKDFGGTPLAVARGILISIPLLLLFGALFTRADASFENLVTTLFDLDLAAMLDLLIWLPICTLIVGGMLIRILLDPERSELAPLRGGAVLGMVETGILLGMLNLLFLGFILSQLGYFFGGASLLASARGLSAATYARRGFFELVTVSLLVLPLLLTVHWLLDAGSERLGRFFRILSGSLVAMLFVIMASAMHRMYLYERSFGLTELRLYTSTFMVWLALVFAWFVKTVLFEKRERFAFGALVSGLAVIALLDLVNPEAIIVSMNTAGPEDFGRVDANYLTTLSSDAVPALIEALPRLDRPGGAAVVTFLGRRLKTLKERDWRSWNLSGMVAQSEIENRFSGTAR